MKRVFVLIMSCITCCLICVSQDPDAAKRYQREAEYYQRQAEYYQRDAESYLRDAKRKEKDAEYYIRNNNYDKARDCFRSAANAMDRYQSKLDAASRAASNAEDYLNRAANALR